MKKFLMCVGMLLGCGLYAMDNKKDEWNDWDWADAPIVIQKSLSQGNLSNKDASCITPPSVGLSKSLPSSPKSSVKVITAINGTSNNAQQKELITPSAASLANASSSPSSSAKAVLTTTAALNNDDDINQQKKKIATIAATAVAALNNAFPSTPPATSKSQSLNAQLPSSPDMNLCGYDGFPTLIEWCCDFGEYLLGGDIFKEDKQD